MSIRSLLSKYFHKDKAPAAETEESQQGDPYEGEPYEFCPRCNANLTLQKGYDNQLPYWVCLGCGEMLINPAVDTEDDIAWICDQCGSMLNIQPGFQDNTGEWKSTECGYVFVIYQSEIYASEDEFQEERRSPYRGLPDQDILQLSCYEEEGHIGDREDIILVRHRGTGVKYIKKLLYVYDLSVYDFLLEHPIAHMPRILEMHESENCLIVIEEYIAGKTLAEILEEDIEGAISEARAISITKNVCSILNELHSLPTPIVHRDVKPSNIILGEGGEVYLLDMNVARWYDPDKSRDTRYLGTREYAAPEQIGYGLQASSAKSDIYAVGILLNVMITGQHPRDRRADGGLWEVIERCIRLEAKERWTAAELITALARLEVRKNE